MKKILLLNLCFLMSLSVLGQSSGRNYVKTTTMLDSVGSAKSISVQYYDAFGYPDILVDETEQGYMASQVFYDVNRREHQRWFPVPSGQSSTIDDDFSMEDAGRDYYGDWDPNTYLWYDGLGRISEYYGGGEEWYGDGYGIFTTYRVNVANSVKRYAVPTGSTALIQNGYYSAGQLSSVLTTDEDGHSLETFADKLGRTVLERRNGSNDTYFVYDGLGCLRFVLSPQYQTQASTALYAYEYRYDARRRVVWKRLPGCDYTQYWYDAGDRLVRMQDARLRAAGRYRFFLYDRQGRLALQGTCTSGGPDGGSHAFVTLDTGQQGVCGTGYVMASAVSLGSPLLEQCTYYDDYAFLASPAVSAQAAQLARQSVYSARGLVTGSVGTASDGERIFSAVYYDYEGRPSEVRSVGLAARPSRQTTAYTFTGQPRETNVSLTLSGGTYMARTISGYGTRTGLPLSTDVVVGGGPSHRTAQLGYDAVNRLASNTRSGSAGTVSYDYNLRGWTTGISSPQFEEQLFYQQYDTPSEPCYNGNISAVRWTTADGDVTRGYRLSYDGMDRMTDAVYGEGEDLGTHVGRYSERVLGYTDNGAVARLERYGRLDNGTFGKVDDLTVTLDGNRLKAVSDAAPDLHYNGAFNFNDGASLVTEYTYDGCGALTSDANKGVAWIDYDLTGMPRRIQFTNGNVTEYVYGPAGEKLRAIHRTAVSDLQVPVGSTHVLTLAETLSVDSTDYVGSFILRNGQPDRLLFAGGYCTYPQNAAPSAQPVFHYYTQDHLGNNRTVVNENGTLEQVTHYYPFGGIFGDAALNAGLQPYKYNGKEFDHTHGLDWYDYGARNYDPVLLQWNGVDPLAGKYPNLTPYSYCGNNPIDNVDVDGNDYWSTNDKNLILNFLNALGSGQAQFDFSGWNHATDAEITGQLTYNDETGKFYTSYIKIVDGEINVIGRAFDANITPISYSGAGYLGAFVYQPIKGFWQYANFFLEGSTYYNGTINWKVNTSGRIIGVKPLTGIVPTFGKAKIWNGKQKMGRAIGKMSGNHNVQNKQIRDLARKYGLTDTEIEELHDLIHGEGYGYHEIEEIIIDYFRK